MGSLWKRSYVTVAILLVISFAISGSLWYQLEQVKSQLNTTKLLLDEVYREQNPLAKRYSESRQQINKRLGLGHDSQSFITPNDPAISAIVQEITGGYSQDYFEYWDDIMRLYQWVVDNIEYTRDTYTPVLPEKPDGTLMWEKDFWRLPSETLIDRAGDCEDMATMLISMILHYTGGRFAVWAVGVVNPEYIAHIAVAIPVKENRLAILDPADKYYTGDHTSWGLNNYEIGIATDVWLAHRNKDMPNAQVYTVFSDSFVREFSSTKEFIDWAREY